MFGCSGRSRLIFRTVLRLADCVLGARSVLGPTKGVLPAPAVRASTDADGRLCASDLCRRLDSNLISAVSSAPGSAGPSRARSRRDTAAPTASLEPVLTAAEQVLGATEGVSRAAARAADRSQPPAIGRPASLTQHRGLEPMPRIHPLLRRAQDRTRSRSEPVPPVAIDPLATDGWQHGGLAGQVRPSVAAAHSLTTPDFTQNSPPDPGPEIARRSADNRPEPAAVPPPINLPEPLLEDPRKPWLGYLSVLYPVLAFGIFAGLKLVLSAHQPGPVAGGPPARGEPGIEAAASVTQTAHPAQPDAPADRPNVAVTAKNLHAGGAAGSEALSSEHRSGVLVPPHPVGQEPGRASEPARAAPPPRSERPAQADGFKRLNGGSVPAITNKLALEPPSFADRRPGLESPDAGRSRPPQSGGTPANARSRSREPMVEGQGPEKLLSTPNGNGPAPPVVYSLQATQSVPANSTPAAAGAAVSRPERSEVSPSVPSTGMELNPPAPAGAGRDGLHTDDVRSSSVVSSPGGVTREPGEAGGSALPTHDQVLARAGAPCPAGRQMAASDLTGLLGRGREFMQNGNLAAARSLFQRAAEGCDRSAALALGASYDPSVLQQLGVRPSLANPSLARSWYEQASRLGSEDAGRQLRALAHGGPNP